MEKRLRGMERILRLQTQMRRREEWRLAGLERDDAALADRQTQLATFMEAETSVSALMADSTARRLRSVQELRGRLAQEKVAQNARLLAQQQRVSCAERLHHEIDTAVRRMVEDDALDEILEVSIGRGKTSLP